MIGFGVENENFGELVEISVRQMEMTSRQLAKTWSSGERLVS